MKYPLLIVLPFITGILLADALPLHLPSLLGVALVLAILTIWYDKGRPALLHVLLVMAGAANQQRVTAVISPYDLRFLAPEEPRLTTIVGTLRETPYLRVYAAEHGRPPTWRTLAVVQVEAIGAGIEATNLAPAFGRIIVTTPDRLPEHFYGGHRVMISGVTESPSGPVAEGLFHYPAYLARHGIHRQLRADSVHDWRLLSAPWVPLSDQFLAWGKKILSYGLGEEDESQRLLWAMTLGWKTGLSGEISEPFMRAGTMHIFAVSGLHIVFIATQLTVLLRALGVSRAWCGMLIIPVLWGYAYVTGFQASAIRATVMSSVICTGWALARPSNLVNSLLLSAALILVYDPQQLFLAGFQLSFAVVLSIAVLLPIVAYALESWLHPEEFLPEQLRPDWQKKLWGIVRPLCLWISVSLACFLGALPITATWFNLFSPISLLSNIVVVPLSSFALAANLFSLMTGAWAPSVAGLLNHAAWFLMHAMKVISDWFAQAPYLVLHVPSPGVWFYLLYYGALLYGLGLTISRARRQWLLEPKPFKPPPGQSLFRVFEDPRSRIGVHIVLGFLAIGWLVQVMVQARETTMTVLPFTSGHAVVCELANGRGTWLIDTGGEHAARFITKPYLQARGVNRVHHLVLTHGDQTHVEGAGVLREYFNVRSVHWSEVPFRFPVYRRAVQAVALTAGKPKALPRVSHIRPWRIISSVGKGTGRADDHAVVLLGHFPACRVLLLSDLSRAGQYRLLETESDLRADIIVLGASGKSDPLTEDLLAQVQPRLIIVADTQFPASARLGAVARAKLKARGIPVLFTSETGAVTLHLKRDTWSYQKNFPATPLDPVGEET